MKCIVCGRDVAEVTHIALDENGEPQVMCDECHDKVYYFFEEVKPRGKAES